MARRAKEDGAPESTPAGDVLSALGPNLRRLRSKQGLALERRPRRSGVSRAMLSQVELSQSAPTINVLWKVARALEVPFSSLIDRAANTTATVLPARSGKVLANQEGT